MAGVVDVFLSSEDPKPWNQQEEWRWIYEAPDEEEAISRFQALIATRTKNRRGRPPRARNALGQYQCSKCKEWKGPDEFFTNNRATSKITSQCKNCMSLYQKGINKGNYVRDKVAELQTMFKGITNEAAYLLAEECWQVDYNLQGIEQVRAQQDLMQRMNVLRELYSSKTPEPVEKPIVPDEGDEEAGYGTPAAERWGPPEEAEPTAEERMAHMIKRYIIGISLMDAVDQEPYIEKYVPAEYQDAVRQGIADQTD